MIQILKQFFKESGENNPVRFTKGPAAYDLIIYDDIYPHPSSGFRLEELTYLLRNISSSKAILSASAYSAFNIPLEKHAEHVQTLIESYPELKAKLEIIGSNVNVNCRLFYCMFLNNIYGHLEWLEKQNTPFVFTLYPGGGFVIGDEAVEERLRKVFSSKCFRKVIVTQKRTCNYLLAKGFCSKDDILFVFGGVVPQESFENEDSVKNRFGRDKATFDICFCANRYTKQGEDKGYPLFVAFMKAMSAKYDFLRFHVIGDFDENVIDVLSVRNKIIFHGILPFAELKRVYRLTDLIICPNQPDKLKKGAFDGFPLGTVIEAGVNQVPIMLTDYFQENDFFEDGKELVIIQPDVDDIINKFESLIADPSYFYKIGKSGQKKFREMCSNAYQMTPRIELLRSVIASQGTRRTTLNSAV